MTILALGTISCPAGFHNGAFLSLRALLMTDTELKLMAAAAIMGESSHPKAGYSRPAATGTPTEL